MGKTDKRFIELPLILVFVPENMNEIYVVSNLIDFTVETCSLQIDEENICFELDMFQWDIDLCEYSNDKCIEWNESVPHPMTLNEIR